MNGVPQPPAQQRMGPAGSGSLPSSPAMGGGGPQRSPGGARPPFAAGETCNGDDSSVPDDFKP